MVRKYEKLIYYKVPEGQGNYVDGTPVDQPQDDAVGVGVRGACQLAGAKAFINGGLVTKPVFMDPYPHKHDSDEYLAFLGPATNRFDFQAHVELTIGFGDDAEIYSIDEPTIVRIPAGTWHCPLNFIRIDRPIFFEVALLQGAFGGLYKMHDGEREMWYNGQINCILDPAKKCTTCQKCLNYDWNK